MRHKSFTPLLVATVIFGPFVAATLVFYLSPNFDWLPRLPGSRELLDPPVATAPGWLHASQPEGAEPMWTVIYARMAACDESCAQDLERLRQVDVALRKDEGRLQRVFLRGDDADDSAEPSPDPELVIRRLDDREAEGIVDAVGAERLELGRVLLADPAGSVMASYPTNVEQKELLRDLKRLLAVGSH